MPGRREVPALARGLQILELLAATNSPLKVSEIAKRLGFPRSATYELVDTLEAYRVVARSSDGSVVLGAKLFMLGSSYASGVDLSRFANDIAAQVRDKCDETVQVAILDGRFVLYIAKAESSHQLRLVSNIGRRLPAHVTGLGKALLASLPDAEIDELFDSVELEAFTPTSISDLDALKADIQATRERGYAIDNRESTPDVECVAAPVYGIDGGVVAAISISVPASRMTEEKAAEMRTLVLEAAGELSRNLGYIGNPAAARAAS